MHKNNQRKWDNCFYRWTFNGSFFGEGIDNALVEINSSEIPILDGSASEFVEAIRSAGVREQSAIRQFIQVEKKVEVREGEKFISIQPSDNDLIIDFEIIYKNPLIRTRRKEFKLSRDKLTEIYNSRTFCLYEDIDFIKSKLWFSKYNLSVKFYIFN